MIRATCRARVGSACSDVDVGMVFDPRTQTFVDLFSEYYVLPVVPAHHVPCFVVICHATHPKIEAVVLQFASNTKFLADVLQFVGRKLESLFDHGQ